MGKARSIKYDFRGGDFYLCYVPGDGRRRAIKGYGENLDYWLSYALSILRKEDDSNIVIKKGLPDKFCREFDESIFLK